MNSRTYELMNYVIIVAGGKGLRMGSDTPKQFLPIGGKPVLMRTIERFHQYCKELNVIVVLPREQQAQWRALCERHHFDLAHTIADGGSTRYESCQNGLAAITDDADGVVGFHDGVRPFVSVEVIDRCFETARIEKAVIPTLPVTDTLRHVDAQGGGKNVLRSEYRIVQTPQVFDVALAKRAFGQPVRESFTDDASVIEALGHSVSMVDGNRENIKITTPFDLVLAEAMLQHGHTPHANAGETGKCGDKQSAQEPADADHRG